MLKDIPVSREYSDGNPVDLSFIGLSENRDDTPSAVGSHFGLKSSVIGMDEGSVSYTHLTLPTTPYV